MEWREIWTETCHQFHFHNLLLLFEFPGRSDSLHLDPEFLFFLVELEWLMNLAQWRCTECLVLAIKIESLPKDLESLESGHWYSQVFVHEQGFHEDWNWILEYMSGFMV